MDRTSLVIFDCDGVLVETEPAETIAILTVARAYGFSVSVDEALATFRGHKLAAVRRVIEHAIGRTLPDTFIDEVRAECRATLDTRVRPPDGLLPALAALAGLPACVASSSPADVIETRLTAADLIDRFRGRIYSAYEVGAWKPDPGLFLHAASACGFTPSQCVVIEDSGVGVQAALAAGMAVVRYAPDSNAEPDPSEVVRISHMRHLPSAVATLINPGETVRPHTT